MKYFIILLMLFAEVAKAQVGDSSELRFGNLFEKQDLQRLPSSGERTSVLAGYIPPAVCIAYGLLSLNNKVLRKVDYSVYHDMQEDHPNFSTKIDNYLQYSPAATTGLLSIAGIKGKNTFTNQALLYAFSTAIMSTSVTFFKRTTHQLRPNGSSYSSFPSGHTATAFAAAEFLNQEFSDRSPWYGIAAYSAATATGILRVYNNAHWFSNVIAGAGFGILSTKAAYVLYPHIRNLVNKHDNITLTPYYYDRTQGLSLSISF